MPSRAALLAQYLADRPRDFTWRAANCCHFAAAWVDRIEGVNPMRDLRETPSLLDARRLVRELGGDLAAAVTRCLGREPILPTLAQVGDIAVARIDDEAAAVGICAGMTMVCVNRAGDCVHIPMRSAQHAWRVGVAA